MERKKLLIGIGAAAAVVIVLAIILISVFSKKKIDLNEYLDIEYSGYDGIGTAVYTIDISEIVEDCGDEAGGEIIAAISGALDKDSGIANGDKITFVWECDDEALENIKGYKVNYSDKSVTVTDLTEGIIVDYFENMEVYFGGYEGDSSVTVRANFPEGDEYTYVRLECDNENTKELKNGDEVVIRLECYSYFSDYSNEELAELLYDTGKWIPKEYERTVVVEGLNTYLTSVEDIPDEDMDKINEYAQEKCFETCYKNSLEGSSTTESVEYVGAYIVEKTATSSFSEDEHRTYFIYEVTVHNTYSYRDRNYDEYNKFYWCIYMKNMSTNEEGELFYNLDTTS